MLLNGRFRVLTAGKAEAEYATSAVAFPGPRAGAVIKPVRKRMNWFGSSPIGGVAMAHQLSVGRVLKRDWPSFGLSVFLSFGWLFAIAGYLVVAVWYPQDKEGWVLAHLLGVSALVMTALCGSV